MADLARQDHAPRPGPELPILRHKANTPTRYLLLSRSLFGLWTHWIDDCSMPCLEPRAGCDGCKRQKPRRWKGYLHAIRMDNREEGFLELTPFAAKALELQVGGAITLRGVQMKCSRGNGQKTRLKIEVVYALPSSEGFELPEEKSPEITLRQLWQHKGFRLRRPEDDDLDGAAEVS